MEKKLFIISLICIFLTAFIISGILNVSITRQTFEERNKQYTVNAGNKKRNKNKVSGPEREQKYFENLHYPYGAILEPGIINSIWNDIKKTKTEAELFAPSDPWTPIGPFGSLIPSTQVRFTGRILDINIRDTSSIKIAAASGGLWAAGNPNPVPLTENISSQAASTFDIQPGSSNVIILGTGEPFMRGGGGLFRTTNSGLSWTNITFNDTTPGGFYKIRFSSQNTVHAASVKGYYRSDDNGVTWNKHLGGDITDVAVNPVNTGILYCARRMHADSDSGGVYKSTNGGNNWTRMTQGTIPTSDVGRTSISICEGSPNNVYVLMSKRNNNMKGIYRTAGADFWVTSSPANDILDGLGYYANDIGVCPSSPGTVLAGGIYLWRTTNFGISWIQVTNPNIHADQHSIAWDSAGTTVWIGHDGGVSRSDDQGLTFNTLSNNFPITQYENVDVALSNTNVFMGGSQDNGITSTTDGGLSWRYNISWGGDGSGAAINPVIPTEFYMTVGAYGGNWVFRRQRSTDSGVNWTELNNGIDPSGQWRTRIKIDNSAPMNVFTNSGGFLYYSTNNGNNWIKRNNTAFPDDVFNFSVRKYADTAIAYVCTSLHETGKRLYVQSGTGNFTEISSDISDGAGISAIAMHLTNKNIAYAVVTGLYSSEKIYKTTNRGVNWTNVSAGLPNAAMTDAVINPENDNIIYLGSEMGCYKTTNGGNNWFTWNDGMPQAGIILQLKTFTNANGLFVLAGTYGRSMWIRKEDSPLSINASGEIPDKYRLYQNYPNPFNPSTKIKFNLAKQTLTKITIFDISGKEVKTIVNSVLNAGIYETEFNAQNLASGVYFYKIEAGNFTDVRKMIFLK